MPDTNTILLLDPAKLHAARERAGLSALTLAQAIATSRPTVYRYEREGRPQDVSVSTLGRLAAALGCSPCDLVGEFSGHAPTREGARRRPRGGDRRSPEFRSGSAPV